MTLGLALSRVDRLTRGWLSWPALIFCFAALLGVYLLVVVDRLNFAWLCLGLASLPTLYWFLQDERKFTPFVLPLALALGGGIWGLLISQEFTLALGIFQTLLASLLVYFLLVHFPFRRGLLILVYLCLGLGVLIFLLFGLGQQPSPASVGSNSLIGSLFRSNPFSALPSLPSWLISSHKPILGTHGLLLAMLVLFLISAPVAFLSRRWIARVGCGIFAFLLPALIILLGWESLSRFFTARSLFGRAGLWASIGKKVGEIPPSGLGLGGLIGQHHVVNPHNAYLQLWSELGIPGLLAAVVFFFIFIWLAGRIFSLRERNVWFGFGLGLILATLACLLIGVVETSPFASAVPGKSSWHLVIGPVAPALGAGLVNVQRILEGQGEGRGAGEQGSGGEDGKVEPISRQSTVDRE